MKRSAYLFIAVMLLMVSLPASSQDGVRRYGVKSGIIKLISSTGGVDTPQTQYFDDYGQKESMTYTTEIPGMVKYDSWIVTKGKSLWMYTIVDGKRSKAKESQNPMPDLTFINPSAEVVEKYKIKEIGEEKFLGRTCKKFNYEATQGRNRVTYTVLVYKGIILKSQAQVRKREVSIVATEFKENVSVPASAFQTEE